MEKTSKFKTGDIIYWSKDEAYEYMLILGVNYCNNRNNYMVLIFKSTCLRNLPFVYTFYDWHIEKDYKVLT